MFYRVLICAFSLFLLSSFPLTAQEKKTQEKKTPENKTQEKKIPEKKTEVLVIEQLSDGFPGADKKGGTLIPQRVYLHGEKLVIQDLVRPGIVRIVRLDQKLIWELNPEKKIYQATPFSKFQELADKRDKNNKILRERILDSTLSVSQKQKRIQQAGLSWNGEDKVEVSQKDQKVVLLGKYNSQRWQVKKNGHLILDSWTTTELPFPNSLLKFYRALGIFTTEEIDAMKKIEGFPLRLEALINLGLKGVYNVTTLVRRVYKGKINPTIFNLPGDFKKYVPPKPKKTCPQCGKEVKSLKFRVVWKRKIYYCCEKEHQVRWMIRCVREKK